MADRVVLHVGTMKSGTTYLQAVLTSGVLDQVGAFYAGDRFRAQTFAVRMLLARPQGGRLARPWRRLVEATRNRDGVAIISQEFLSFAGRPRAGQVVASFDGVPLEVVVTVRDQRSAIAAQWQSYVRNRGTLDLAAYVGRLQAPARRRRRSKAGKSFRRAQDVTGIARRWGEHDGVGGLALVVVPPSGSEPAELWRRFCAAAGLEAHDPPAAAIPANESLGYASCDALRRVNAHLLDMPMSRYRDARRDVVEALLPLRAEEVKPRLDRAALAFASELNQKIIDVAQRPGVRLVGSADELPVDADGSLDGAPDLIEEPEAGQVRRALEVGWAAALPGQPVPGGTVDELATELGQRLADIHGRRPPARRDAG